ncbi:hypothetical protein SERLA73DRAFT_185126 [Serpula lacrymans var. lacrymans S7.3]|uniref:Uncharacterized protein n=2 Tax=Serpula lacrymans var. lacrymans TaxID=341189 RepID=F8Q436_SERL3|nr:WD40 repeat-containing protein [Serpula lacrymans var. lacrymans S7.9]EGN96892.1 hypothetical protein SERLA73DRAFT_185126 [Serpula lacrymans var. lacrymans S7.3]EGO22489.1 WD40 repeat-containing protein [Serpula lacrymans var. lacrymans S7.9]
MHKTSAPERKSKKAKVDKSLATKRTNTPPPTESNPELDLPVSPPSPKGKQKAATVPASNKNVRSEPTTFVLPSSFKVVAGSYEKLLYGLEGTVTPSSSAPGYTFHLNPIFIFPAHVSCIKAVAASPNGGKWLATGSADEIVKVWDLRRRKEIGGLMHHEGSITELQFPSRSHLLSSSEDGTLCLFRARDWAVLRSLKGHKGAVNSVAIHPSGKVALSVGKDKTLRMWDLMRGKGSASTKLGKEGELVRWSVTGSCFVVQCRATIEIYTTDMVLQHIITHPSRIHSVKFCTRVNGTGEVLFVGAEDKKVSIYEIHEDPEKIPTVIAEMVGHSNRVKAVEALAIALPPSENQKSARLSTTIVCTVSSDGKIHVYDLASLPAHCEEKLEIHPVAEYDTKGTRLTCMTIAEGEPSEIANAVNGKRKRADNGHGHEDSEEEQHEGLEGWHSQGEDDGEDKQEEEGSEDEE